MKSPARIGIRKVLKGLIGKGSKERKFSLLLLVFLVNGNEGHSIGWESTT